MVDAFSVLVVLDARRPSGAIAAVAARARNSRRCTGMSG
jgi:hypothetical protein